MLNDRSAVPPTCPAGMQLTGARCQMTPDRNGWCPPMQREDDHCMGGATLPPSARSLVAHALMLAKPGAVSAEYARLFNGTYAAELFANASLADVKAWAALNPTFSTGVKK
jgi:hypothetical protein